MSIIQEKITQTIIDKLNKGIIPWVQEWKPAQNFKTKTKYTGINRVLLSSEGTYFLTYKQAIELNGQVKKGAKGFPVVYMSSYKKKDIKTDKEKDVKFFKGYTVFKIEDIDDINITDIEIPPIIEAETIIKKYKNKPKISHYGSQPRYIPSKDLIELPRRDSFIDSDSYYSTLFHELGHSTGHPNRLKRELKGYSLDNVNYAKEELIAELTSAFLCQESGITKKIDNQSAYIQSWLKILKNNTGMIISAASKAEKATNHILGKE